MIGEETPSTADKQQSEGIPTGGDHPLQNAQFLILMVIVC
jgi:hypothetical protein